MIEGIKIFYDGIQIQKYGALPFVEGFTTNTSIMKSGGITNYKSFMEETAPFVSNRSISLQLFEDDDTMALLQADEISSLGANVYVKVPIVKSDGNTNTKLISTLLEKAIKVNVTTIFTYDQIDAVYDVVTTSTTPCIVSIFAGRISDTCVNPVPIIKYATTRFRNLKHVQVLWAGCKETLSIQNAKECGCHIITIPDAILDRISRLGKDLTESSIETAFAFRKDAVESRITIL